MAKKQFKNYLSFFIARLINNETQKFSSFEKYLTHDAHYRLSIFFGIITFFLLMVMFLEEYSKAYYFVEKNIINTNKPTRSARFDCQLNNKNLSHCNFSQKSLKNADLTGANLDYANLSGADLSGAKLNGASLIYANLKEYVETNKKARETKFYPTKLIKADLTGANLFNANLSKADLSEATLRNAIIVNSNLSDANLSNTDLTTVVTQRRTLEALIEPTDRPFRDYFRREISVTQKKIILAGANISGSNLTGQDLSDFNLKGVNFQEANLSNTKLVGANLTDANLTNVNFEKAVLISTNVSNSNLQPCDFDLRQFQSLKGLSEINTSLIGLEKINEWKTQANSQAIHIVERNLISNIAKYNLHQKPIDSEWLFLTFVLGGYFTDYGADPLGIFWYVIISYPVFTFFYYVWMHPNSPKSPYNQKYGLLKLTKRGDKEEVVFLVRDWRVAFWFGLLSATHIGYGDIQPGSWLPRLQLEEYTLKGQGRVRRLAGCQSLLSIYTFIVLITTYFNNPFA